MQPAVAVRLFRPVGQLAAGAPGLRVRPAFVPFRGFVPIASFEQRDLNRIRRRDSFARPHVPQPWMNEASNMPLPFLKKFSHFGCPSPSAAAKYNPPAFMP